MKNNSILLEDKEYEIIEDVRDGLDLDELKNKYTDFFYPYDYIVGDWAYGKLRLKGFYDDKNPIKKDINNIKNLKKYIDENCAFNCKYFVVKKVYKNK
ncbi:MAG: DUF1027 domain-containing protein [Bacilli bacterium]|nr:DUF1027 domain-containing protein [Bacilli bacterium]